MSFNMDIYTDEGTTLFDLPYTAKRLLDDSVERTFRGYQGICDGAVLTGSGNMLLARVESVAAFSLAALVLPVIIPHTAWTACRLVFTTPLNIVSRLPGISSSKSVQNFTHRSNEEIYRISRIYLKIIPIPFLFLAASAFNTVFPGVLRPQNVVFDLIHSMVESLGPLKSIRAIGPDGYQVVGTKHRMSSIDLLEEMYRALSSKNYIKDVHVSNLKHIDIMTIYW